MNENVKVKFRGKLVDLCEEFGIKNVSIAGTHHDEFIGILLIDEEKKSFSDIFESVINIGRLWQHSRTIVRSVLNDFEK